MSGHPEDPRVDPRFDPQFQRGYRPPEGVADPVATSPQPTVGRDQAVLSPGADAVDPSASDPSDLDPFASASDAGTPTAVPARPRDPVAVALLAVSILFLVAPTAWLVWIAQNPPAPDVSISYDLGALFIAQLEFSIPSALLLAGAVGLVLSLLLRLAAVSTSEPADG